MTSAPRRVPSPYDICGELPRGTALLEASAGTGKTYTIAALATRLVAEGHCELSELLLVTFSRAATRELRERVRRRFVATRRALHDPAAIEPGDDLARLLAHADPGEVSARAGRLTRALSAFDGATIATTHAFCRQLLAELGIMAGTDTDRDFLESSDDLVVEVADDLYVADFAGHTAPEPTISAGCARDVARAAASDPHATLLPGDANPQAAAGQRVRLAAAARDELRARKRDRRLIDYDDLLSGLRDALAGAGGDDVAASIARQRIRDRYRYVLVDEFQDTDPVQWEILRRAFHGHTNLVLIGDPKQAIYAFRGADVVAYLDAARQAESRHSLDRNWRSEPGLLRGLDELFGGAALGDPQIVVRPVTAAHKDRRLAGAPAPAPLRLRLVRRDAFDVPARKTPPVAKIRSFIATDLTADILALLRSGATLTLDGTSRPLVPGDLGVLVRKNDQAELVRNALRAAGLAAVVTGLRSVFLSPAASEWLVLLRALQQPHRSGLVRAAALTSFVGWDATFLATCADADADELALRIRGWRDVLVEQGVAAAWETISDGERLPERLLARPDGERLITDLRHVTHALHEASVTERLGLAAVAEWLARRIADAAKEPSEERSRRLDTDADAVQVLTVHASKGLQFPVVYVPLGWDRWIPDSPDQLRLHDETGRRVLDVGGVAGPGHSERRLRHRAEEDGEDLRLLYVALTRAQCQAIAWWAPSRNTKSSALHRLLFAPRDEQGEPEAGAAVPGDAQAAAHLQQWAARADGCVTIESAEPRSVEPWTPGGRPAADLAAATFGRALDLSWRRTSYSALTAAAHEAGDAGARSEPEDDERRDEPPTPAAEPEAATDPYGEHDQLSQLPSPMAAMPAGAAFGTIVHRVLESVDTSADDLAGELGLRSEQVLGRRLATDLDAGALAAALLPAMRTPLGPLAGDRTLADIPAADRLAELEFELPLAGGDEPRGAAATLAGVAQLLRDQLAPDDPLAAYPAALDRGLLPAPALRGYLTGSIDAVLRVRPHGEPARYLVADYKTNRLGRPGFGDPGALSAADYRPAALQAAMIEAHYPLQALLYSVALHRYLRWRQPAYDPAAHLGGVLYLFLRGMCGPDTPTTGGVPAGVFSWRPPAGLVTGLSDLLDRGPR